MRTRIEVKDRDEAKLIKQGLKDEKTRALVKVMGALMPLPSDRARSRVLHFVADKLAEDATHPSGMSASEAGT